MGAVAESTVGGAVSGGLFEAGAGLVAKGLACSDALATRAVFRSPSLKSNAVLDGVSTVSIDGSGKDIGADENASSTPDRYFRAIVLTPEIEQYVAENGFISGKLRGLVQEAGGALPESYPLEERIVQYVEGTPDSGTHFPKNTTFVGFYKSPDQAINTGWLVGFGLRKANPDAFLKLYEVDLSGIDVEEV